MNYRWGEVVANADDAGAVALHVTAVHARDDGYLSVFPYVEGWFPG